MKKRVLNQGFVSLLKVLGDDITIVRSARVSYGSAPSDPEKDKKLIEFLMKNEHETPFEHVVFQFHVKCPIFVARQWFRHRWGSFNEISGRYVEVPSEFYMPSYFRRQVGKNYEYENMSDKECNDLNTRLQNFYTFTHNFYKKLLKEGVAKEQARMVLPLGMYTQFYWTVNARSLMNFLRLRLDNHAQKEIQEYAQALMEYFRENLPWTADAFLRREFPHLFNNG
jgi:thymidylate synthase (FAD)